MIQIEKYINKYKNKFGLKDYKIEVAISDDEHYVSDRNSKIEKVKVDYYAEVVKTGYKQYTILINRNTLNKSLKSTIIHELLHIMFWEMIEAAETIVEFTTLNDETKIDLCNKMGNKEHLIIQKLEDLLK